MTNQFTKSPPPNALKIIIQQYGTSGMTHHDLNLFAIVRRGQVGERGTQPAISSAVRVTGTRLASHAVNRRSNFELTQPRLHLQPPPSQSNMVNLPGLEALQGKAGRRQEESLRIGGIRRRRSPVSIQKFNQWRQQRRYTANAAALAASIVDVACVDRWKQNVYPFCALPDAVLPSPMSRHRVIGWLAENYPGRTFPRSACRGCPYRTNEEWRMMRDTDPASFEDAVAFDKEIRLADRDVKSKRKMLVGLPFVHRSLKPLDEVDLRTDAEKGQRSLFDQECEGMCGV